MPDAGLNGGLSFGEKLSAALQAAENVASLLRGEPPAEEAAQTESPSADSSPSPRAEEENTRNTAAQSDPGSRKSTGEAYARFIQRQEALSKKIGGR